MVRMAIIAAVAILAGCGENDAGSGEKGSESKLVGQWVLYYNETCSDMLTIKADSYEKVIACLIDTNRLALEISKGTYIDDGSSVVFTVQESTCSVFNKTVSFDYVIDGKHLTLTGNGATAELVKFTPPDDYGTGIGVHGCYDDETGDFVPNP